MFNILPTKLLEKQQQSNIIPTLTFQRVPPGPLVWVPQLPLDAVPPQLEPVVVVESRAPGSMHDAAIAVLTLVGGSRLDDGGEGQQHGARREQERKKPATPHGAGSLGLCLLRAYSDGNWFKIVNKVPGAKICSITTYKFFSHQSFQ